MIQGLLERISDFTSSLGLSVKTLARVALKSRRISIPKADGCRVVILGNGPSLSKNLENDLEALQSATCLAVNFFANSPWFYLVKPRYYVLADPHFFANAATDQNVGALIENLQKTDWPMTLFIPASARNTARRIFRDHPIAIATFNFVRADGFHWLENLLWQHSAGMPRPRNVLIPSLMLAINMGYRQIILLGADHSWLSTLSVTDDNRVVSVQPHFYKADDREEKRISAVYDKLRLDQVLESMTIAFKAYHSVNRFAIQHGVSIINCTPGSMIDAFKRGNLQTNGNL